MGSDRLVRIVAYVGWSACAAAILLAWAAPEWARLPAVQWTPWALGLLILGIPHGALDHRVGVELRGRPGRGAGPAFYAAYLAAFALVAACWFASPAAATAGFLLVAGFHFGQGDVYWSREAGLAARSGSVGYRVALLAARGVLPVALPALAFPELFAGELAAMAGRLFGAPGWSPPRGAWELGLAVTSACVALQVGWAGWIGLRGDAATRSAAGVDVAETALLVATFAVVPPLLAVGVYFHAWHALRHVARLLRVSAPARALVESGQIVRAFGSFAGAAVAMSAGAVLLVAGLGLAVGRGVVSTPDLGFVALMGISALTLPHAIVVAWMDLRQGVWTGRGARLAGSSTMSTPSLADAGALGTAQARPARARSTFPIVILGAGCSGLSLAWNLVELGVDDPILLVDRRDRFDNDRTWGFWDVEPTPFSDLATHAWRRWRVHDGRRDVVSECPEHPYLRLRAADVYRRTLARLAEAPNVTLALGRPILGVREGRRGVAVATAGRSFVGLRVFDSTGRAAADAAAGASPGPGRGPRLLQHFLGQTVRANRPAFDPGCPTLMDFRASQADGPHFTYVLPLSETEALVENTYLYPFAIDRDRHRAEVADYLRARHGLGRESYRVVDEESGAIPMAVGIGSGPAPAGSRVRPIGLAGGAARPSSGYAFLRIQREAARLARAIADGVEPPPARHASRKYEVLDAIFLRVLADRPDLAPGLFGRMFAGADAGSVVRFLSERSGPADDASIIAALPKWPFVAAAARAAYDLRPGAADR